MITIRLQCRWNSSSVNQIIVHRIFRYSARGNKKQITFLGIGYERHFIYSIEFDAPRPRLQRRPTVVCVGYDYTLTKGNIPLWYVTRSDPIDKTQFSMLIAWPFQLIRLDISLRNNYIGTSYSNRFAEFASESQLLYHLLQRQHCNGSARFYALF